MKKYENVIKGKIHFNSKIYDVLLVFYHKLRGIPFYLKLFLNIFKICNFF